MTYFHLVLLGSGKSLLMRVESMHRAQILDCCELTCPVPQNDSEFNFGDILLLKCVDTSGNVSKCSGFEFQPAED